MLDVDGSEVTVGDSMTPAFDTFIVMSRTSQQQHAVVSHGRASTSKKFVLEDEYVNVVHKRPERTTHWNTPPKFHTLLTSTCNGATTLQAITPQMSYM